MNLKNFTISTVNVSLKDDRSGYVAQIVLKNKNNKKKVVLQGEGQAPVHAIEDCFEKCMPKNTNRYSLVCWTEDSYKNGKTVHYGVAKIIFRRKTKTDKKFITVIKCKQEGSERSMVLSESVLKVIQQLNLIT